MQNNLVTCFIKETFDNKCKNILLGDWCKPPIQNQDLFKNSETIEYHLNDHIKLENGHRYLNNLFYKVLKNLTIHMNDFHQEDRTQRYWHIVLGQWLGYQISTLWDRWECLSKAFKDFDINKTKCLKYNLNELIASDIEDFTHGFAFNHKWNHILYSEIIKFNYASKVEINFIDKEDINFVKENYIANSYKKKSKLQYVLLDFLLKIIFRRPKIIIYKSYFSIKNKILLPLSLGEMPRSHEEFNKKIKMPTPNKRENIKFNFETDNDFEEFLKIMLFKLMPVSYLEGYKLILSETNKISYFPRVILTAIGHLCNDIFQIWTANQILNGTKFLVSDHGGSWEKDEYFAGFKNTTDFFLSWNKGNDKKCIQVPINLNLNKKKILKKNKCKKILIISNTDYSYTIRLRQQPICSQVLQDYNLWKIFVDNLSSEIKDNVIFRPHTQDHDYWNLRGKFEKDFDPKYISKKKILEEDLNRSKIIVNTVIGTTLYESMKTGIPVIILFNRKTLNIDPNILKLKELMINNKIIFTDPLEASNHIKKIWTNPLLWWNSNKILQARESFTEYCSMEAENNLKYWKTILENQINKKSQSENL